MLVCYHFNLSNILINNKKKKTVLVYAWTINFILFVRLVMLTGYTVKHTFYNQFVLVLVIFGIKL